MLSKQWIVVLLPAFVIFGVVSTQSMLEAEICATEFNEGPCCEPEHSDLIMCNGGLGPPCYQYEVECPDEFYVILSPIGKKTDYESEDCIESRITNHCVGQSTPPLQECEVALSIGYIHGSVRAAGRPCTQVNQ